MDTLVGPAIRANVPASQPDSPSRVKNVCRRLYRTNGRDGFSLFLAASILNISKARPCCFFKLEDSTWPLLVGATHTQPSAGLLAASQRVSSTVRTRGVIGSTRRAAAVLP